ncbi:MAG TPA: VPDSG-CTERM sorting domain-containing protein [Verrucomicrobiales bacterium]|nr:VPDSG-CTERM sorting domain-containing protein [Verrucomicrobiales bacterium]
MNHRPLSKVLIALAALSPLSFVHGAAFTLSTGAGDGGVTVGVDGYGAFGSSIGANATDAIYNPVGGGTPAGTSFESGVAIRFGSSGTRQFLTSGDIGGSGNLVNPTVTGTTTSGSSTFSIGGLNFTLTQTITPLFVAAVQTGSILTQSYSITNPGNVAIPFELVRYLDGDLAFDGSIVDGGGRLIAGSGAEVLFETDTAAGTASSTTFVGITAEGGTAPATGRFEVDSFSDLRSRILAGNALDDGIAGDSADADQFIDVGNGYDVTLALNNIFSLGGGQSTTYTTSTIFGAGAPERVEVPTGVPDGGSTVVLLGAALGGLAWARRKMRA